MPKSHGGTKSYAFGMSVFTAHELYTLSHHLYGVYVVCVSRLCVCVSIYANATAGKIARYFTQAHFRGIFGHLSVSHFSDGSAPNARHR